MYFLLVPYFLLVIIYLVAFKVYSVTPSPSSLVSAFFKCLPILYLILLVTSAPRAHDGHHWYKSMLTVGLVFSMFGDFFLTWFKDYFVPGVASFALAQICYSLAFGWDPLEWEVGLVVALTAALLFSVLFTGMKHPSIRVVVAVYLLVIGTMAWRATALYKTTHRYEALYTFLGAWSFALSDTLIALSQWKWRIPRSVFWIMTTYYLAQVLLALSALIPGWRASRMFQFVGI